VRRDTQPLLMLECFLKEAEDLQRPQGLGDTRRRMQQRDVGRDRQEYSQPNPPAAQTRPDTIVSQKALIPPPVT